MEGRAGVAVFSFENIDLASSGPLQAGGPESRPVRDPTRVRQLEPNFHVPVREAEESVGSNRACGVGLGDPAAGLPVSNSGDIESVAGDAHLRGVVAVLFKGVIPRGDTGGAVCPRRPLGPVERRAAELRIEDQVPRSRVVAHGLRRTRHGRVRGRRRRRCGRRLWQGFGCRVPRRLRRRGRTTRRRRRVRWGRPGMPTFRGPCQLAKTQRRGERRFEVCPIRRIALCVARR